MQRNVHLSDLKAFGWRPSTLLGNGWVSIEGSINACVEVGSEEQPFAIKARHRHRNTFQRLMFCSRSQVRF
jgi:hypothetical protein